MPFKSIKKVIKIINSVDKQVLGYEKTAKIPSLPSVAYLNWSVSFLEAGRIQDANKKLTTCTEMGINSPETYINLGLIEANKGNFEQAKEYYIKAITKNKKYAKAYCFLGNVLTDLGEYKQSEDEFKIAHKLEPLNPDIMLNWGISLSKQKKFIQAKEKFEIANKLSISNPNAIYFLGLIELEFCNYDNAEILFKNVISIIPQHIDAIYYLSYVYMKKNDYDKALLHATLAYNLAPPRKELYMLLGEINMHLEKEEESINYYIEGEKNNINNYFFYISWGLSYEHFNKEEAAIEKFNKAIEINPKNEIAYACIGNSYIKLKHYNNALENLLKAQEINPKNEVVLCQLGDIALENKDFDKAVEMYNKSLEISSKFIFAYEKLAKCYNLRGNKELANEIALKAFEYGSKNSETYIDYAKNMIYEKKYQKALNKLKQFDEISENNIESLNIQFLANFFLAKEENSNYNKEKALDIAKKIKDNNLEFSYEEELEQLKQT